MAAIIKEKYRGLTITLRDMHVSGIGFHGEIIERSDWYVLHAVETKGWLGQKPKYIVTQAFSITFMFGVYVFRPLELPHHNRGRYTDLEPNGFPISLIGIPHSIPTPCAIAPLPFEIYQEVAPQIAIFGDIMEEVEPLKESDSERLYRLLDMKKKKVK